MFTRSWCVCFVGGRHVSRKYRFRLGGRAIVTTYFSCCQSSSLTGVNVTFHPVHLLLHDSCLCYYELCVCVYTTVMTKMEACPRNNGRKPLCLCGDMLHNTSGYIDHRCRNTHTHTNTPLSLTGRYANLFLHPVRDDDAPGYRDVIHRPMDLSSIKRNIETGVSPKMTVCVCVCQVPFITLCIQVTITDTEFQRDMLLMFQNAFMYNSSDHDVLVFYIRIYIQCIHDQTLFLSLCVCVLFSYDMAEKMRADVMQSIQVRY